jgi:serine/threonine protein kinase
MPEIIGQTINNRYRVDAFVGRGGMAEVYKVWDNQRSVPLAMKILHEDLSWSEKNLFAGWLKDVCFPVTSVRQVFINKDGNTSILYLASSDTTITREAILLTYQKQ